MNSTFKIGLAPALVLLPALLAEAAQTCCEARVSERLDRLNVSPSDIRRVFYEAQRHIDRAPPERGAAAALGPPAIHEAQHERAGRAGVPSSAAGSTAGGLWERAASG